MRDTNDRVDVLKRARHELVRQNARGICEPKQAVVGEHRSDAQQMRVQNPFVT